MTDRFDDAALEFFNGPWQFMRMVTPDVRGRYVAAQANLLRDTHNAALEEAAACFELAVNEQAPNDPNERAIRTIYNAVCEALRRRKEPSP